MKLACWNVRTLVDDNLTQRPERRTALIAHELKRYSLDIVALSETRLRGDGQLNESGFGFSFLLERCSRGSKERIRCWLGC